MPIFRLTCRVEAPLERVWAFHDDLDSLAKITPPGIRMEVLLAERPMRVGSTILFRVKQHPLAPPYVWEALIVRHEPPHVFVDQMVRGPFARFVHTHRFEADGTGPDETHVGLRIMRERAQNIGASVEVASVPGSGTCVVLKLPERLGMAA